MIPKYSINFSWKKPGKSPRASGLLDPGFGRAGPRKNGSGGRVLQARPVTRNITILLNLFHTLDILKLPIKYISPKCSYKTGFPCCNVTPLEGKCYHLIFHQ